MWNQSDSAGLRIASLKELDALVAKHLTNISPTIYWEEQHASFRFGSLEEAQDSLNDPFFIPFLPTGGSRPAAFVEVREFPAYSSDINEALKIVERLTECGEALQLRREKRRWIAAFGDEPPISASTAAVAICLAGLNARGIHVDFTPERTNSAARNRAAA